MEAPRQNIWQRISGTRIAASVYGDARVDIHNHPQTQPQPTFGWLATLLVVALVIFLIFWSGWHSSSTSQGTSTVSPNQGVPTVNPNQSALTASSNQGVPTVSPNQGTPTVSPNQGVPTVSPNSDSPLDISVFPATLVAQRGGSSTCADWTNSVYGAQAVWDCPVTLQNTSNSIVNWKASAPTDKGVTFEPSATSFLTAGGQWQVSALVSPVACSSGSFDITLKVAESGKTHTVRLLCS